MDKRLLINEIDSLFDILKHSDFQNEISDLDAECVSKCNTYLKELAQMAKDDCEDKIVDIVCRTNDLFSREFFKTGFRFAMLIMFDGLLGGADYE